MSNTKLEVRISTEDFENDGSKEVVMVQYISDPMSPTNQLKNEPEFAVFAYSSKQDGVYDKTSTPDDADGDGDVDEDDRAIYLDLANTFVRMANTRLKKNNKGK